MALPEPKDFEVKLAFHPDDTDVAIEALGLTDPPKEEKRIHFFDNVDLACFDKGLILRARQSISGGNNDDLTLKLRGPNAPATAERFQDTLGSKFEGDKNVGIVANPAFSITASPGTSIVTDVVDETKSFDSAVSPEAQQIMREVMHPDIKINELTALGPIESQSWKLKPEGFDSKIAAELWNVNGMQLLELSEKVSKADVKEIEEKLKDLLKRTGLRQLAQSKTRFALQALT